jgi:hypothetical protein
MGRTTEKSWFYYRKTQEILIVLQRSRLALGPTRPSIQWVPDSLASGVRRTGREFDHSPPSGAEVKNEGSYTSAPSIRLCVGTNLLALQ